MTVAVLVALALGLGACTTPAGPLPTPAVSASGSGPLAPAESQAPAGPPPAVEMAAETASTEEAAASTAALPAGEADADAEAPVLMPFDPLQPEASVDLNDSSVHADLWARVRAGFAVPDLDTPSVHEWEMWYATRPDYVARMTARGSRYLFHITEEIERRHMPTELALLPFTESAFNPQAMSVAKASGMWQFVPATGKTFDLKQNVFRDDRRDVLASTRAALDYLQKLHGMFGDWQLALAAYNWGEGNVQRAIARNQKAGRPVDYLSLNMPNETRGYVPKLQAVKNIVAHPEAFGLALPAVENHPYFLSVPIERDMDIDLAARLAGISLDAFKELNPQMNKPVILAAGTPQVLLPYDNADRFVQNVEHHQGPLASWTAWVATRTLKPAEAAQLVGMSEAQLREVNHIPARMLVKPGSTLLVPRSAQQTTDVAGDLADGAAMILAPEYAPTRRQNLRIGKGGESVASVARRLHVGAAQLAAWNHVGADGRFAAGATVVTFVPRAVAAKAAPQRSAAAHPAGRRSVAAATRQKAKTAQAPRPSTVAAAPHRNKGAPASNTPRKGAPERAKSKVRVAQP